MFRVRARTTTPNSIRMRRAPGRVSHQDRSSTNTTGYNGPLFGTPLFSDRTSPREFARNWQMFYTPHIVVRATGEETQVRLSDSGDDHRNPDAWKYLLALVTISVAICYADRSNISTAIVPMAEQYDWDKTFQGFVLSSFFLGYACTQMLGGALADKYGGKSVLLFGVTAWSFFTFFTPQAAMGGAFTLIGCRILMGLGEGVAFPSIHSIISRHIPQDKQTTAVGIATAASYAGTAAAFGLAPAIIDSLGWEWAFYTFGASAALWLPFWWAMEMPPSNAGRPLLEGITSETPRAITAGETESSRLLNSASTSAPQNPTVAERLKELWDSDDVK